MNPAPRAACKYLAQIDAARCIGCNLCRQACPFDAIAGAPGYLYKIIDRYCTGCRLCIAPCPVDCITMRNNEWFSHASHDEKAQFAKASKMRASRLQERLKQQVRLQQADYTRQKQGVMKNAVDMIASLQKKLDSQDNTK